VYGDSIHQQVEEQHGDNGHMTQWNIQDNANDSMAPLCDLRATFEQRTGGLTTLERLTKRRGSSPAGFLCSDATRAEMIAERTGLRHIADGTVTSHDHPEINSPWDVLSHLPQLLVEDLKEAEQYTHAHGATTFGEHRIDVHPTVTICPNVTMDASVGAIRIEEGATVRPGAVLCGPCWIGKHVTIVDNACIKANTSIGPWCKIGGEVGGTIFQAYTNKSHDGHLGDSVIGEWVNFGAGTINSNLLNTYADVIVKGLDGKRHRTNNQFVGCFVGDHVKFAIGTRIMTGSIVGTGSMLASSMPVPTPTPRFSWITDAGTRKYAVDKCITVAKTVMARRSLELGSATESVFRRLANE
jgi:UDP-N-acetylglucosamine diphosphorylase/glucosamine-1-phosphate N-acetyltransferase